MKRLFVFGLGLALTPMAFADGGVTGYRLQRLDGSGGTNGGDIRPSTRSVTSVDLSGQVTRHGFNDAANTVLSIPLAPGAHVDGIGWDTNQTAFDPSWLSEMRIEFTDTAITEGVGLTPSGDNNPGSAAYSSGGIVDLVGLALDFNVGADGLLRIELWETFDDGSVDPDGIFDTLSDVDVSWTPEPTSLSLLVLGGLALLRRR